MSSIKIVNGNTEPIKENLWLNDGKLKLFTGNGWTDLFNQSGESGSGTSAYLHIRYSDSSDGTNMNTTGGKYIGTYTDSTATDSTDKTKYTWVLIKGDKGDTGTTGVVGKTPGFNTPSVSTLASGSSATVTLTQNGTDVNGNPLYDIAFGIPKGEDGTGGTSTQRGRLFVTSTDTTGKYRPSFGVNQCKPNTDGFEVHDLILDSKNNYRIVTTVATDKLSCTTSDIIYTGLVVVVLADQAAYTALATKNSNTLYVWP